MNLSEEIAKRRVKYSGEIGQLAYERYVLCKQIEDAEERIAVIDRMIADDEVALRENDAARRNFNTYLAIKEGAVTLDQIKKAVEGDGELRVPPEAVMETKKLG